jgi:hypothetical protein
VLLRYRRVRVTCSISPAPPYRVAIRNLSLPQQNHVRDNTIRRKTNFGATAQHIHLQQEAERAVSKVEGCVGGHMDGRGE